MGFAGLLAAVIIGLIEWLVPLPGDFCTTTSPFDAVILSMEGVEAGVTLRWGIIGLATLAGQWIKKQAREGIEITENENA